MAKKSNGTQEGNSTLAHDQEDIVTPFVLHDVRITSENMPQVEHVESHGDKWAAVFPDLGMFVPSLPQIINEAKSKDSWFWRDPGSDAFTAFMLWPDFIPPGIGSIIEHEAESDQNVYATSYPVLEGVPAELSVTGTYQWENGLEGELTAIVEEEREISFFDCFYFKTKGAYPTDRPQMFKLAALAFLLEPAQDSSVSICEGEFYEAQRQEFLEENPDKTAADFPQEITISFRGARLLIPRVYASEYEFRTTVLSVETVAFEETKFYRFQVKLCQEGNGFPCFLYASEHVLNGYMPAAGDDVQGVFWLSGYRADELD